MSYRFQRDQNIDRNSSVINQRLAETITESSLQEKQEKKKRLHERREVIWRDTELMSTGETIPSTSVRTSFSVDCCHVLRGRIATYALELDSAGYFKLQHVSTKLHCRYTPRNKAVVWNLLVSMKVSIWKERNTEWPKSERCRQFTDWDLQVNLKNSARYGSSTIKIYNLLYVIINMWSSG
jgi:hypothetical protein